MTRGELYTFLRREGYTYERDNEYHRDVFTNYIDGNKIEVFADYYTVRILWWYEPNRKTSTSAYISKVDESILRLMIKELISK